MMFLEIREKGSPYPALDEWSECTPLGIDWDHPRASRFLTYIDPIEAINSYLDIIHYTALMGRYIWTDPELWCNDQLIATYWKLDPPLDDGWDRVRVRVFGCAPKVIRDWVADRTNTDRGFI